MVEMCFVLVVTSTYLSSETNVFQQSCEGIVLAVMPGDVSPNKPCGDNGSLVLGPGC
jgi:hypothetical protein